MPNNLKERKTKWNSKGYYDGKYWEATWKSKLHGDGVDRGYRQQDGHWDTETGGRII